MAERICSIPDCEEPIRNRRGWCNKHYLSWRRHGDPLAARRSLAGMPLEERLWGRVDKLGPIPEHRPELGPCWLWQGTVNSNGYGWISKDRRGALAHRVAYELLVGPIPEGLEPDHLCRATACVKPIPDEFGPTHLELVTHAENMGRSSWATSTHCKRGHLLDEANTYRHPTTGHRRCRTCYRNWRRTSRAKDRQRAARAGT